jgi:hypothetical protein
MMSLEGVFGKSLCSQLCGEGEGKFASEGANVIGPVLVCRKRVNHSVEYDPFIKSQLESRN